MKNNFLNLTAFISSFLFALGLAISGMTQPKYVIGFLDIFGNWYPQLFFVMLGAILIYAPFQYYFSKKKPLLSDRFYLPVNKSIDWKLCTGSIIFGVGWGLAGYCPGPALTALLSLSFESLIFVIGMLIGIKVFHFSLDH